MVDTCRTLSKMHVGTCEDYSYLTIAVLRSKGIPVIMDFLPQWPYRSFRHSWCVLLDDTGKEVVFDASSPDPGKTRFGFPLGKVFRNVYAINREVEQMQKKDKYVPPTFKNPCIRDVSDHYMATDDVEINLNQTPQSSSYAYLAVFDNQNWVPVHYGKISGKKAMFRKMGRNVLYLPVCWRKNGLVPVGDPFILSQSGVIQTIIPDTIQPQMLCLRRKYPAFPHTNWTSPRILDGRIQVSNRADFKDSLTVYTIKDHPMLSQEIRLDTLKEKYRYWRYYGRDDASCNIADLYFFPENQDTCNTGKIIGTEGSYENRPSSTKYAAFDGNPLTAFDAPVRSGAWVGMDFGKPVGMKKVSCVPRGDGNCVTIGNEYELFYWGSNQWNSLGRKKADNVYLTYENCPQKALFLLRNHTIGKQERIFTYEDGEQIWW